VKATVIPDVLFQPHSSVLDMVFYNGEQFPAEYRGDAFVALIPNPIDQNPWAHWRSPMDMMRQG
jgi:hypothetical protein